LFEQVRLILELKFPHIVDRKEKAIFIAAHLSGFDDVKLENYVKRSKSAPQRL
jgi:hypothetical protein